LTAAPESARATITNNFGYSSPDMVLTSNVGPFGASETIREAVLWIQGTATSSAFYWFAMARYNFSDVSIGIGNTATATITIRT
jgi:hypothetical protein